MHGFKGNVAHLIQTVSQAFTMTTQTMNQSPFGTQFQPHHSKIFLTSQWLQDLFLQWRYHLILITVAKNQVKMMFLTKQKINTHEDAVSQKYSSENCWCCMGPKHTSAYTEAGHKRNSRCSAYMHHISKRIPIQECDLKQQ